MKDTEAEEIDLRLTPDELRGGDYADQQETFGVAKRARQQPDYYEGDEIEPLDDLPGY